MTTPPQAENQRVSAPSLRISTKNSNAGVVILGYLFFFPCV